MNTLMDIKSVVNMVCDNLRYDKYCEDDYSESLSPVINQIKRMIVHGRCIKSKDDASRLRKLVCTRLVINCRLTDEQRDELDVVLFSDDYQGLEDFASGLVVELSRRGTGLCDE